MTIWAYGQGMPRYRIALTSNCGGVVHHHSCPRRHSGEGRNPVIYLIHSRRGGNDDQTCHADSVLQAGKDWCLPDIPALPSWIPACAGMTVWAYGAGDAKISHSLDLELRQGRASSILAPAVIYGHAYRDVSGRAAPGTAAEEARSPVKAGIHPSSFRRRPESSGLFNPFPPRRE